MPTDIANDLYDFFASDPLTVPEHEPTPLAGALCWLILQPCLWFIGFAARRGWWPRGIYGWVLAWAGWLSERTWDRGAK